MTYFSLKKYIKDSLSSVSGEYAGYEAEKIVTAIFGIDTRTLSLLYKEEAPDKKEEADIIISRRKSGEPLSYILGSVDFFGLTLEINSACLTPRADTEVICEKAVEYLSGKSGAKALDICTGSGCIALAVAANSDCTLDAADISEKAIETARRNAEKNGLSERINFFVLDVFSKEFEALGKKYDLIVSNPPYIPTKDIPSLSAEVLHEPHNALDGGEDGLIFYRRFLDILPSLLNEGGQIIFEIGYDQNNKIEELCRGRFSCEFFRDYGGNIRGAIIKPR
ncbi:MAG: peptide chain release factor N(5)-glutamine methyltransferase [Eubacteriales bacterium]